MADKASDNPGFYLDGAYVLPARANTREVWKAFRYRLFPKPDQVAYFNRLFGCCRWVYNHFLQKRIDAWQAKQADPDVRIPTWQDMAYELTRLKRETVGSDGEHFLRKVDSTALVYELKFLDAAFVAFFKRVKKGTVPPGFPRFKGKGTKRSATVSFPNRDYVADDRIRFAKLGWVRANVHRPLEGQPVSATISVDAAERWWVSIKCKCVVEGVAHGRGDFAVDEDSSLSADEHEGLVAGEHEGLAEGAADEHADLSADESAGLAAIALSVGDDPWIVTSEGEVIDLDPSRDTSKIAREKRRLAKCEGPEKNKPPSVRYERQRLRTAKLFAHEADHRAAEINNLTSHLVDTNATIVVRGAGSSELARQLRYKCAWAGRAYVELLDPVQPSNLATPKARVLQAKRDLAEGLDLLRKQGGS